MFRIEKYVEEIWTGFPLLEFIDVLLTNVGKL